MENKYPEIMTYARTEVIRDLLQTAGFTAHSEVSLPMQLFSSGDLVVSCDPHPSYERYRRAFPTSGLRAESPETRVGFGDSDTYAVLEMEVHKSERLMERLRGSALQIFDWLEGGKYTSHLYEVDEVRDEAGRVVLYKPKTIKFNPGKHPVRQIIR
jgi:hypothetical protein